MHFDDDYGDDDCDESYERGYDEGYSTGYNEGYSEEECEEIRQGGYNEGYNEGYNKAIKDIQGHPIYREESIEVDKIFRSFEHIIEQEEFKRMLILEANIQQLSSMCKNKKQNETKIKIFFEREIKDEIYNFLLDVYSFYESDQLFITRKFYEKRYLHYGNFNFKAKKIFIKYVLNKIDYFEKGDYKSFIKLYKTLEDWLKKFEKKAKESLTEDELITLMTKNSKLIKYHRYLFEQKHIHFAKIKGGFDKRIFNFDYVSSQYYNNIFPEKLKVENLLEFLKQDIKITREYEEENKNKIKMKKYFYVLLIFLIFFASKYIIFPDLTTIAFFYISFYFILLPCFFLLPLCYIFIACWQIKASEVNNNGNVNEKIRDNVSIEADKSDYMPFIRNIFTNNDVDTKFGFLSNIKSQLYLSFLKEKCIEFYTNADEKQKFCLSYQKKFLENSEIDSYLHLLFKKLFKKDRNKNKYYLWLLKRRKAKKKKKNDYVAIKFFITVIIAICYLHYLYLFLL